MSLHWYPTFKKSPKGQLRALKQSCRKHPEPKQNNSFLLHAPAVCNTGDMPAMLLRAIRCRWCKFLFYICRCCWRGQAYCCKKCRIAGKRKKHREAEKRYRQTEKGKKRHREAENRRRHGHSKKKQKNMDDATSIPERPWVMKRISRIKSWTWRINMGPCCRFCGIQGRIVAVFPRRGYG